MAPKWIIQALLLINTSLLARSSDENPHSRVVDGLATDIREAPYFAVLARYFFSFSLKPPHEKMYHTTTCGSTIISRQWVITVAHCVINRWNDTIAIFLALGVDDIRDVKNMPRRNDTFPHGLPKVDLYICHPNYARVRVKMPYGSDNDAVLNDICLLRADHDLQFGATISSAGLHYMAYDRTIVDKEFTFSGFGKTFWRGNASEKMFSTKLKLLQNEECERRMGDIFDEATDICTTPAYKATSNTCYGDSGGGLIYKDNISNCPIVTGVLSMGEAFACGANESQKFTSVMPYKEWIEETMERYSRPSGENSPRYAYPERNRL